MSLVLYEYPSTRSTRDRWILQELEVPFESVIVDLHKGEHRSISFLSLNPAGRVPVLVDGDLVLRESAAIAVHLGDCHPDKRLMPADPPRRAQVLQWLFFTMTELEQPLWRITRHTSLYPKDKRSPAEIELARADFAPMAKVLSDHLEGRKFLLGEAVCVADFVLAFTLDWAFELKLLDDFPVLAAYAERMYSRPRAPLRLAAARKQREKDKR